MKKELPSTPICENKNSRREFLSLTATTMSFIGACCAAFPFLKSLGSSKKIAKEATFESCESDVLEIETSSIKIGETKIVMWKDKPVFIRNRTEEEIKRSQNVVITTLIDPQSDEERFSKNPQWLIVIGICTHLNCIPYEKTTLKEGDHQARWLCPCHGALYDDSGRVIRGPAVKNLIIPPYEFINNGKTIRIGGQKI